MCKKNRHWLILVTAILIPVVPFIVIGELPGEKWLSAVGDNNFLFGITGAVLLVSDLLLPIPSSILGSILGAKLGLVQGCLWTWLGLTVGNFAGYGLGRLWPDKQEIQEKELPTLLVLLVTRPVPVLAEALTLASGALRMPFLHFAVVVVIGNLVYAFGLAALGASLLSEQYFGFGVFAVLVLIGSVIVLGKKWREK